MTLNVIYCCRRNCNSGDTADEIEEETLLSLRKASRTASPTNFRLFDVSLSFYHITSHILSIQTIACQLPTIRTYDHDLNKPPHQKRAFRAPDQPPTMTDSKLDQIVKGQPPPSVTPTQVANSLRSHPDQQNPTEDSPNSRKSSITAPTDPPPPSSHHPTTSANDPRDNLPSSPPQIYLNLLILESSLRLQYLSLRARLRLHLVLVAALTAWLATFTYLLFLRPREDGSGVGGSVYWVLETCEKLAWTGGVVTALLFWGTGMYERGVRWPRRFVGTTNRGLRGFNLKVVLVRGGWVEELIGWLGVLDPLGWWGESRKVRFQVVPREIEASGCGKDQWNLQAQRKGLVEEDVAPGGDVVRLLLLPKPFSPDFREGWDGFRADYWDKENARRAALRRLVKVRSREVARREGGWFWWTGWRGWRSLRGFMGRKSRRQVDLERLALREWPSPEEKLKERERRRKEALLRPESQSRGSSRSTTPAREPDADGSRRVRRGSSAAGTARRNRRSGAHGQGSRLSATETVLSSEFSEMPRELSKRSSNVSSSSTGSDDGIKKEEKRTPRSTPEIKQEPEEA